MKTEQDFINWFMNYTLDFVSVEEGIHQKNYDLKIQHTIRVVEVTQYICQEMKFDKRTSFQSVISAYLHDVGRFTQYEKYHTFSDPISIDHAQEGIRVIEEKDLLNQLTPEDKQIIITAIAQHNKKELDPMPKELTTICNVIRDADKLDIYEVILSHLEEGKDNEVLTLHLKNSKKEYSPEIPERIINNELIDYREHKYVNDMLLTAIGWSKQLNFKASFKRFKEKQYHRSIAKYLPKDEKIELMLKNIDEYLEERLV